MKQEVELPKRSALSQARRMGGGLLMMVAIFGGSLALFSVVVFLVIFLVLS